MRYLIAFLCSLLLVSSCQKVPASTRHQCVRINIKGDPLTLDPRKGGDLISATFHFLLFDGLVHLNDEGRAEPALAETIDTSPDGLSYTFHLRNAIWSDGSPITAHDFEYSWKTLLDPHFVAPNSYLFYPIRNAEKVKEGKMPVDALGVSAKSDRILCVYLEKPVPYFLELLSFCTFFPVQKKVDQQFPEWAQEKNSLFISSGPFRLKKWRHHREMVLEKNLRHWEKEKIALEEIDIAMIENESTILHLYEKGFLDIVDSCLSSIPIDSYPELLQQKMLTIRPSMGTVACIFNTQVFPFSNCKLRQAFAYALNRRTIVEHLTYLEEEVATGIVPPLLKKTSLPDYFKDGNIESAQELFSAALKELNISKNALNTLVYSYSSSSLNHKIAQAIQEQWYNAFGIKIRLECSEHKTHLHKLAKKTFSIAQTVWFAQYPDPMSILERFKSRLNVKNYPDWENPTYKELLEASFLEKNLERRLQILEEAEKLLMSEMPICPLYHCKTALMVSPHVKNANTSRLGDINFKRIYIDDQPN